MGHYERLIEATTVYDFRYLLGLEAHIVFGILDLDTRLMIPCCSIYCRFLISPVESTCIYLKKRKYISPYF